MMVDMFIKNRQANPDAFNVSGNKSKIIKNLVFEGRYPLLFVFVTSIMLSYILTFISCSY